MNVCISVVLFSHAGVLSHFLVLQMLSEICGHAHAGDQKCAPPLKSMSR